MRLLIPQRLDSQVEYTVLSAVSCFGRRRTVILGLPLELSPIGKKKKKKNKKKNHIPERDREVAAEKNRGMAPKKDISGGTDELPIWYCDYSIT